VIANRCCLEGLHQHQSEPISTMQLRGQAGQLAQLGLRGQQGNPITKG
jgi:hypothetical protein